MYKYIRKWIYEEVNRPIIVKAKYPDIQIDDFEYYILFKEGGILNTPDRIGIMISTIYNNELFYEYGVIDATYFGEKQIIINEIKNKLKENIKKFY